MSELFKIIHEDHELLVINKPAGLVCHPTKGDAMSSLISRVRLHLGETAKPHMVNRLDRETSGVTIVAKGSEVAGELGRLWEMRSVAKEYQAIVHGHMKDEHGTIDLPLGKDEKSIVAVKDCVRADGAASQTEYWVEQRFERPEGKFSLLRLAPRTGRKHQLRIHLAHLGHPIVGDKLYGGDEDLYMGLVEDRLTAENWKTLILPHQALHASVLKFEWRGKPVNFSAQPEAWFLGFVSR